MKYIIQKKDIHIYLNLTLSLICTFWIISITELYFSSSEGGLIKAILFKFVNDFWCGLVLGGLCFPLFILLDYFVREKAFTVLKVVFILFVLLQFSLVKYSLSTLLNLGADILGYSIGDIFSTVTVSESVSIAYFIPFVLFPLLFFLFYKGLVKYVKGWLTIKTGVLIVGVFGGLKLLLVSGSGVAYQNKIAYLTNDIIKFQSEKSEVNNYDVFGREDYPLLKPFSDSEDVLSSFIEVNDDKPNVVVIVVEGLGSEFVNENEYSGFTPYIDSLISKSLYWENFVSTTGRSFGILPSLLGSLPYGEKGFLELTDTPSHISLISVLKANGYTTSYYSGGPSSFDRKINFLEYNGIDNLIDESKYGSEYLKTNSVSGGFAWGYPDKEIFRKAMSSLNEKKQPRLDIVMSLSNHEPFEYPNKDGYMALVDSILQSNRKSGKTKKQILKHKDIFGCLVYTDESIKGFMESYAQRPEYSNTIFIITGDHRLIPIAQKDKLCRFHVPFLIYSPMLKRTEKFKSISSHWDVTPSLLSFLMNNYKFNTLEETSWMSNGLDTAKQFRNIHKIPLMKYKGNISDYIYKDYLYSDGELFKINENFGTFKVNEDVLKRTIADSLLAFKKMNAYVTQRGKIFPDSLNIYIKPKLKFSEEQIELVDMLVGTKSFDEIFLLARDFAVKKQYKNSRLLCNYILNEFPNYTDARLLKGRTLAWEQDYAKAEIELLNAQKRYPYYDDVYLALLDLYWWSGQEEKSKNIFLKALGNNMINPEISFKMVKAYKRMGSLDKANKLMDSIIKKHPNNLEYLKFKKS